MLEIKRYESNYLSSNMYIITDNAHSVIIDPCEHSFVEDNLLVDYIILTHEHFDHISGVKICKQETGAPIICSKACAENIKDSRKNLAHYFNTFCKIQTWVEAEDIPQIDYDFTCEADYTFEDSEVLSWGQHMFELFEIPGHSLGSIGIMMDDNLFFSGDSLLENYEIELGMPGGNRRKWKEIGEPRIGSILYGTKIYPGHFSEFIYKK